MDEGERLVKEIRRLASPCWQLQQRAPRVVRIHPDDLALPEVEADLKSLGSTVEASDEVPRGHPEVIC